MLIGFIIGGFIFFVTAMYFVVLFLYPEWVGVSGRDHQKHLAEQRGDVSPAPSETIEEDNKSKS